MPSRGFDYNAELRQLEGIIRGSAFARATTAQIWDAVHGSGITATFAQVNEMRAAAVSQRRSMEAIGAASPSEALRADMIGISAFARDPMQRAANPQYQIRIPYEYTTESGDTIRDWISKTTGDLPATIEDLGALAQDEIDTTETPPEGATVTTGIQIFAQ